MQKEKTKAEQVADISWDDLVKLKAKNPQDMKLLRSYVNLLRQGYNRRIAGFERKGVFSYAAEAAKKSKIKNVPVTKLVKGMEPDRARNTLLSEFAKYQQFFHAQTSTIEGINKVNAEQDERIFGENSQNGTMSADERKTYWNLYEEFMESDSIAKTAYMTSERVQQMLAEAMFDSSQHDIMPVENGADEYGIEMKHLNYPEGSKLYNMYKTEYLLRRKERIEQLGRVDNGKPDSPIFINGGND